MRAMAGPRAATLTVTRDRYLDDHRVDGRPVLPFAVAMELMAEVAAATRPGADVAGLRGIRLLHGVVVDVSGRERCCESGRAARAPRSR